MSQGTAQKKYRMISPFQGVTTKGSSYNTREVLQESGEWESPITGTVKVTVIGAGGAGASATLIGTKLCSVCGYCGGDTSFGDIMARGGHAIGSVAQSGGTIFGGGGFAGAVEIAYVDIQQGDLILYSIGAGGVATVAFDDTVERSGCMLYPPSLTGLFRYSTEIADYEGGSGGSNGTPYGGGGGGASFCKGGAAHGHSFGAGGGEAGKIKQFSTSGQVSRGGNGGDGAIILEYYDPQKKA